MDLSRLDLVLQYVLAVAEQPLTATQLIKYVYLADLAFARANDGQTYTETPWVFLHYGPYSRDLHDRIPQAAAAIGVAPTTKQRAADGGEYLSYRVGDNPRLAEQLRDLLPPAVASAVRWTAKEHGADTPALLDEAYRSEPMRQAAPGDRLDFTTVRETVESGGELALACLAVDPKAAWKVRRDEKAARERITAEMRRRWAGKASRPATGPAPRYDEVYVAGVKALDALTGDPIPAGEHEVMFATEVWKSPSRRGPHGSS